MSDILHTVHVLSMYILKTNAFIPDGDFVRELREYRWI